MSNRNIHFISGLPRSGSTLLCNILAQNPAIHTTPTSACHETLFVLRNAYAETRSLEVSALRVASAWGNWIEHQASPELGDTFSKVILAIRRADSIEAAQKEVIQIYHGTDRPVVIDKGRGWLSLIELAEFALGREAKVIVPVRSIPQILASFEKLHRKSAHSKADEGNYFQAQTVDGRAKHVLDASKPLGLAYNRLRDALQRGLGDRLHLVEFDDLTHEPEATMKGIYEFLELDPYSHNFNAVEQYTHEDDSVHGMPLHDIRSQVKPIKDDSNTVLGSALVKQYTGTEFWRN
jgi:sulfotransferase